MHILIATDGSRYAQEAVNFGVVLGRALQAGLSLVGVSDPGSRAAQMRSDLHAIAEALEYGSPVPVEIRSGKPADQILRAVKDGNADMLVAGTRSRGWMGRLLLGDTAQRLAREVRVPMVLVRRSRPVIRRILVCTGGGEHGRQDVEMATEIAAQARAELVILHVMSQLAVSRRAMTEQLQQPAAWHQEHRTREGEHLSEMLAIAAASGVSASAKLRWGLVVDQIVAEARQGDYDLVTLGAHGGAGFQRYLLDDVTEAIIAELGRPVLIVR
jgi:nucleotide-binding universal stress UspA family protein